MKIKNHVFEHYMGDVNLEYGGYFYDPSDLQYGYANALRITDLDNAAGVNNVVMIERVSICMMNGRQVKSALNCCDASLYKQQKPGLDRLLYAMDACMCSGLYDLVSDYSGLHTWIVCIAWDSDDIPDLSGWDEEIVVLAASQDLGEWMLDQGMLSEFE